MSNLLARIEKDCNGRIIELKLGYKTIDRLYVRPQEYDFEKYQVDHVVQDGGSLGDLDTLYHIFPGDEGTPHRLVKDSELDKTEVMLMTFETDVLFRGTEKQCIRYAEKWLEQEYAFAERR